VRGAGPNDRKGQQCLGLEEGIALAILPRQALGRHSAVKPQWMLTRELKPTRRPQSANAQPAHVLAGTNLSNRRMRTRMYGGVAGEER
jgi:hypothetical protein